MANHVANLNLMSKNISYLFDKICKSKDNKLNKFIDNKNKINKDFITYRIEYWEKNKHIKWVSNILYFTKSWIHIVLDFGRFLYKKKSFFPAQYPGFSRIF